MAQLPEDLSIDEAEAVFEAIQSLPLTTMGQLVAEELFGERMETQQFLTSSLDETQPLQAEFIAKFSAQLESQGYYSPDGIHFQAYRKKGGWKPEEGSLGKHSMAICLSDFQVILHDGIEMVISEGESSPLFESLYPEIPRNRTKTKSHRKNADYLSLVAWAVWDDQAIRTTEEMGTEINTEMLERLVRHLQEQKED